MIRSLLIFLLGFQPFTLAAQPSKLWEAQYNGAAGKQDYGRSFVIDSQGNSYMTGSSDGMGTGKDVVVVKFDSNGNQVWMNRFNGSDSLDDWSYAIARDRSGNLLIAGETGTRDHGTDFLVIKYDIAGNRLWVRTFNGLGDGNDVAVDIALDQNANVFVTGKSAGDSTADDYLTLSYDSTGKLLWENRYNGTGNSLDDARTIQTDEKGNVYVSGGSMGDISDFDFLTIKYSNAGKRLWTARYNGLGNGYDLVFYQGSLVTDSLGNVYVCGYSTGVDSLYQYTLVKYDSSGHQLWDARLGGHFTGQNDFTDALALDDSLNCYITGAMYDSMENYNITTIKYNRQGKQLWQASYNGPDSDWDEGYSIITADSGIVYVGGRSNKLNFTGADFVIIKYNRKGKELWNVRYSRGGFSWPFKLRKDGSGNLYIGGWSSASSPAAADFTIVKYGVKILGIEDHLLKIEMVKIFPNPTQGDVEIQLDKKLDHAEIRIYDASGNPILGRKNIFQNERTSLGNLVPGIYILKILSGFQVFTKKLIIE